MIRIPVLFILIFLLPTLTLAELPRSTERFEQMLIQAPAPGRSFDEVFSHFAARNATAELETRWRQALDQHPEQAWNYHLLLGLLNRRNGHLDTATEHYQQAATLTPNDYRAYYYHGQALASTSHFAQAIEQFQQAITLPIPPHDARNIYEELARLQQRTQQPEAATATWLKLGELFPDDPQILEEVGDALLENNRHLEARETYEKMIAASSHDPYQQLLGQLKIAELLERSQKTEEALELYTETLDKTHSGSWLYREVATRIQHSFRKRNDIDGLVEFYKQRHTSHPQDIASGRQLARLYTETGNRGEAAELLAELVSKSPHDHDLHYQYALLLMQEKQYETAATILKPLVQRQPTDWGYREALGEMQLALLKQQNHEDFSQVIDTWKALVPNHQESVSSLLKLADLYRRHQLYDPALETYQRALALDPEAYDLRVRIAEFLFDQEKEEEAWQMLRNDNQPLHHAADYQRLAQIELNRRLHEEALITVNQGLQLAPDSYPLLQLKWQILHRQKEWLEAIAMLDSLLQHSPSEEITEQIEQRHIHLLRISEELKTFQQTISEKLSQGTIPVEHELRIYLRSRIASGDNALQKDLQQALQAYPDSFLIARLHSQALAQSGQTESQVASLRHLMTLRPERSADWLRAIIKIHLEYGQTRQAGEVLNELAILTPDDPDIHIQRAELAYKEGKIAIGHESLRQAIRLSNQSEPLKLKLAEQLLVTGSAAEALALLEEIFAESHSPGTRVSLIELLAQAARQMGILESYSSRFLTRDATLRNTPEYHLYRGELYAKSNDYDHATIEWKQGLDLDPQHPQLLFKAIDIARLNADHATMQQLQELVYRQDPSPENALNLALSMIMNSQVHEALEVLHQSNQGILDHPEILWQVVETTQGTSSQIPLLTTLESQLGSDKDPLLQQLTLAQIQIYTKQLEQAKETLWAILRQAPVLDIQAPENALNVNVSSMPWIRSWLGEFAEVRHPIILHITLLNIASRNTYNLLQHHLLPAQNISSYVQQRVYANTYTNVRSDTFFPSSLDTFYQSLIHLAGIAVHEQEEQAFLEDLNLWLEESEQPDTFKATAYTLLGAKSALENWIEELLEQEEYDETLYELLAYSASSMNAQSFHFQHFNVIRTTPVIDRLTDFMVHHNHPITPLIMTMQANKLLEQGETEKSLEMANKLLTKTNMDAESDLVSHNLLTLKTRIASQKKRSDISMEILDALDSSIKFQNSSYGDSLLANFFRSFPEIELNQSRWEQIARIMSHPANRPNIYSSGHQALSVFFNFPIATDHLPPSRYNILTLLRSQSEQRDISPLMAALEKQAQQDPSSRQVAQTLRYVLKGLEKQTAEAINIALELIRETPDEGTHFNLGLLYEQSAEYDQAITHFQQIASPSSPLYIPAQLHILQNAHKLKNQELARKTALLVTTQQIPLPFLHNMSMFAEEFNDLGIPLPTHTQATNHISVFHNHQQQQFQRFNNYRQELNRAQQANDRGRQLHFARILLKEVPTSTSFNQEVMNSYRNQALRTLESLSELDSQHDTILRAHKSNPRATDPLRQLIEYHQFCKQPQETYHYFQTLLPLTPHDDHLKTEYLVFLGENNKQEEFLQYLNHTPPKQFYLLLGDGLRSMIYNRDRTPKVPILDYLIQHGHVSLMMSLIHEDLKKFSSWTSQSQYNALQQYMGLARYLIQKGHAPEALDLWKGILKLRHHLIPMMGHIPNHSLTDLYQFLKEQQTPLLEITGLFVDNLFDSAPSSPSPKESYLLFEQFRAQSVRPGQNSLMSSSVQGGRQYMPMLHPFEFVNEAQDLTDLLDYLHARYREKSSITYYLLDSYLKTRLYDLSLFEEISEQYEEISKHPEFSSLAPHQPLSPLAAFVDGMYFWPSAEPLFEKFQVNKTSSTNPGTHQQMIYHPGPENPIFQAMQAELHLEQGAMEEAREYLEKARKGMLSQHGNHFLHTSLRETIMRLYLELGDFEPIRSLNQELKKRFSSHGTHSQESALDRWFALLEETHTKKVEATVWTPPSDKEDELRIAWELHPEFHHIAPAHYGKSFNMSLDPLNGLYNMKLEILTAPQGTVLETFEFDAIPARGEKVVPTQYTSGYLRTSFTAVEEAPEILSSRVPPFSKAANRIDNPKLEYELDTVQNRLRFPGWTLPNILPVQRKGGPVAHESHTSINTPFSRRFFHTITTPIRIEPNQSYLLSGWIKSESNSQNQIQLEYLDITGSVIHIKNFHFYSGPNSSVWMYLTHELASKPGNSHTGSREHIPLGAIAVRITIEGSVPLRFSELSLREFNPEEQEPLQGQTQ